MTGLATTRCWLTFLATAAAGQWASAQERSDSVSIGVGLVTSVAQGTVYVGAGRLDGLREGAVVTVRRLGERGRYRVAYLSSRSAACVPDSGSALPAVGDTVVFVPVLPSPVLSGSVAGESGIGSRRRGRRLRGRVGLRYLSSADLGTGSGLRQPGLEILLDGPLGPGVPVGLSVDVRSRRTSTYRPGQPLVTRGLMGVYQAALRIQSARGAGRVMVGRQYAPTLAGVGLFDGLMLDFQRPTWGVGAMAGFEPEPGSLSVSSEVRQFGLFLQGRGRPGRPVRWSLTLGGVGSYVGTEVNREFAFLQGTVSGQGVHAVLLQELDLNRGWRARAGEHRLALTSTYASLTLVPTGWVTLSGGFDSRRNLRLYRDLTTPEELFDDRVRLGVWGGVGLSVARRLRLGGEVRRSTVDGTDSLRTTAVSGYVSVDRFTALGLGLRLRVTRFETPARGPGMLLSGTFRIAPGAVGALEVAGGQRRDLREPASSRRWAGANGELALRRSWFALASFSREWGREGLTPTTDQLYGGLSYRF